jgi:hypothetical protein
MKAHARPTPEGRKAERALQRAVGRVIERNRRLGMCPLPFRGLIPGFV